MMTRPERCAAASLTAPSGGFPAATRCSGLSSPWSTALRIMWVSGSASSSTTVLSTSVDSPSVRSRTSLPVASATSRTIRDMRWNSGRTGWARIAITLSWISRVSRSSSSRLLVTSRSRTWLECSTRCVSMAWLMTSSPTRLMSLSTRSRSTRIVGCTTALALGAAGSAASAGAWAAATAWFATMLGASSRTFFMMAAMSSSPAAAG